ncbi:DMT family transporter [Paenibacillus donghaensis]|uniref:QacE family quaternary ammonium compound efflux SMR transporter n=1 Tax=Paenibacillus donghaensis TaxID=414771 RepID=A0A2Z2KAQ1_9BACL|nr:multidrug efflux SMR transporter [Paenibacillus donghaensis]ASA19893.1 QacE family quaternary ammonium compound efflux SMR transporter [Paenibacillus donghaensis]
MRTNIEWIKVAVAAGFEVLWAMGLKHASTPWEWGITAVAILISFYGLISASAKLPVGTVYSVFVGLGTMGTMFADMLWFGEDFKWIKLVLVGILLVGVMGLKKVTAEPEAKEES